MRFLNFLISKQGDNSKVQHSQTHRDLSYFEYFYDLMEQIFTSVYYPETYLKKMESSDKDRQNLSP